MAAAAYVKSAQTETEMLYLKNAIYRVLSVLFPSHFGIGIPHNFLTRQRYQMLEQALAYTKAEQVGGDYLEFGVARGRSLIYAYSISRKYGWTADIRFVGFDSFQGFPQPKGIDTIFERFKEGEQRYARSVVEKNLKRYRVDRSRTFLVEGWYEDTLSDVTKQRLNISKARVVNIDCDLYDSALLALRFITDAITNGTVILFDDWLCYRADPNKGEQAAVKRWLSENPNIDLIPYRHYANVGQSFIVHIE